MKLLLIASVLFVSSGAWADFTFLCNPADSKTACLHQFRKFNSDCCYTSDGKKVEGVTKPSTYCKVKESTMACESTEIPNRALCTVKSECSDVSGKVMFSSPVQHECVDPDSFVVYSPTENSNFKVTEVNGKKMQAIFCLKNEKKPSKGTSADDKKGPGIN